MCCLYILSYLDRGNIGNAKAAGAKSDLKLSDSEWAWVLNSFYIAYVVFEWTNLFWKILPASKYVTVLCILWVAPQHLFNHCEILLMVMKLLAGALRQCPQVLRIISGLWQPRVLFSAYLRQLSALAPRTFCPCFTNGANWDSEYLSLLECRPWQIASLLPLPLESHRFAGPWSLGDIYSLSASFHPNSKNTDLTKQEGAPTIAFGAVTWFYLADSPGSANFLSEADKTFAVERLQQRDNTKKSAIRWDQVFAGMTDYQNYVHTLIHFCNNYSFAALSNFLPTIVRDMGYSTVTAQGLTAPPYLAAFVCCVAAAWASDRYGMRGFIVSGGSVMATAGYLILVLIRDESKIAARYTGVFLASCGIFPAMCINITWLLNNQGGDSKKGAGLAILATLGQCSSFMSSVVFPTPDGSVALSRLCCAWVS